MRSAQEQQKSLRIQKLDKSVAPNGHKQLTGIELKWNKSITSNDR